MSRSIKFRAWDKENKQFVYWDVTRDPIRFGKKVAAISKKEPILEVEGDLQQFTGLLDKNGKEIYEGDVVQCGNRHIGILIWDKECACFNVDDYFDSSNDYPSMAFMEGQRFEVLGNINEDKRRLKMTVRLKIMSGK